MIYWLKNAIWLVLGETSSINKFREIGFDVFECDGHKVNNILSTLKKIENSNSFQPKLILANTIKGKGVSFMENKMEWHYLNIDDELLAKSYDEVENYIF